MALEFKKRFWIGSVVALSAVMLSAVGTTVLGVSAMTPSGSNPPTAPVADPGTSSTSQGKASSQAAGAGRVGHRVDLPTMTESKPVDYKGLHNVVAFGEGFLSGGAPEGEAGFEMLKEMGVKTIISVDGAEPEVAAAKERGIRYIHLPIGYNGFDEKRKLELVRATRDAMADGPVYIHCHHGKHRSAGAAGTIAASLGWMTAETATERMKVSGTAPEYKGLYSCTANATALDAKVIDAVKADFPEVSHPATFVKSMVEIDEINEHLKAIEKAGWNVPKDHPDLVPVAEAGRMADLFRFVSKSDDAMKRSADFAAALRANGEHVQSLEDLLVSGEKDVKKLSERFKVVQTSCRECHARYRD